MQKIFETKKLNNIYVKRTNQKLKNIEKCGRKILYH